jgi:hypothetical protein
LRAFDFLLPLLFLAAVSPPIESQGQWLPPDSLRDVPVLDDCNITRHGIGLSVQPNLVYPHGAIFMCSEREREIDARHPGASRFFLVHEYGHLAMHSRLEAVADEWAAKQLARVPAETGTLRAVLLYFVDQSLIESWNAILLCSCMKLCGKKHMSGLSNLTKALLKSNKL